MSAIRRIVARASIGLGAMLCAAWLLAADEHSSASNKPSSPEKTERVVHRSYLGVATRTIPPGMEESLPEQYRTGQGVFVLGVAADSPAEKSGVKPGDIILTYDDQKLFVPRQLSQLVRTDKADREVTLGILRSGKTEELKTKLAGRDIRVAEQFMENRPEMMPMPMRRMRTAPMAHRMNPEAKSEGKENGWETFDSMTLQKVGKDKFKAQIQYIDENGKMAQRTFEGNLEEIRKDITTKKDLPETEREQLIRSLDRTSEEFDFPGAFWIPGPQMNPDFDEDSGLF